MKSKKTQKQAPLSLLQTLIQILKGKGLQDGPQPEETIPGRDLGVIEDPLARSLFYERYMALDAVRAYEKRAKRNPAHARALADKFNALSFMLSEVVGEKFPIALNPEAKPIVSKDWHLIVEPDPLVGAPFENLASDSGMVFSRLSAALTKKPKGSIPWPGPNGKADPAKSAEPIIGRVADSRIRVVHRIMAGLIEARKALVPSLDGDRERHEWMLNQTYGELARKVMQAQVLDGQIEQLKGLFFALVRETLPPKAIPEGMTIGVRGGWKIVAVPAQTPGRGLIGMLIELGALPDSFFRRLG